MNKDIKIYEYRCILCIKILIDFKYKKIIVYIALF